MSLRSQHALILASAFCLAGVTPAALRGQAEPAPAPPPGTLPPIPGLTAVDPFPGGCVDCHVQLPEENLDVRISTLMRQWYDSAGATLLATAQASLGPAGRALSGSHPEVEEELADIPDGCLRCHGRRAVEAPPFSRLLHRIHLVGGEENVFLSRFQGECTYCHKLDPATGQWSLPSGPEPSVQRTQGGG